MYLKFALLVIISAIPHFAFADEPSLAVGLLADLSGPNALPGEDCRRGYELARRRYAPGDTVGSYHLNFIYGDHRGEAKEGINEFRKLVSVYHIVALSSPRSQVGMAISPLSKQLGIPFLGCVGHAEFTSTNPYAFRFYPSATREGSTLAEKAIELGKRHAAVLTAEDEWTLSLSAAFTERFTALGGKVEQEDKVAQGENDFRSVFLKYGSKEIDVIFINLSAGQLGQGIRQLRELKRKEQILANMYVALPEVRDAAGAKAIAGTLYVEAKTDYPEFHKEISTMFNEDRATSVTLACYSGVAFMLQTLRHAASVTNPETLYRALLANNELELFGEKVPLKDRDALVPLEIKEVH